MIAAFTPDEKETPLEIALQAHLKFQVAEYGETLVDHDTLLSIARGDGYYANTNCAAAIYWIAADHNLRVDCIPTAKIKASPEMLLAFNQRPELFNHFRVYDPVRIDPKGPILEYKLGEIVTR